MATNAIQLRVESPWQKRVQAFWSFLQNELKSSPERYTALFHLVAAVMLALWINVMFGLSDIGISLYMPFFFIAGTLKKNALSLVLVAVTCAVGLLSMLFVMDVLGGSPPVRFVASTAIVFVSMYMIQATQLPQPWLVLAIFGGSFLRAWDSGHTATATVTGNLRLVLSLLIGCSSMVFVQFLVSVKGPLQRLQDSLVAPLEAVIGTLSAHINNCSPAEGQKRLQKIALQGAAASKELLKDAGERNGRVQFIQARLGSAIEAVTVLVDQTLWFSLRTPEHLSTEDSGALRTVGNQLRDLENVIRAGCPPAIFRYPLPIQLSWPVADLIETVQTLAAVLRGDRALPQGREEKTQTGFFKPGALQNKGNLISGFKTTLAATICYALYTGTDWPQIDTSVTTCIITTQESEGMEHQKQVLRLIGDSLAGICAIGSIALIMPHLSSIAGLTALVGVVTLLGGYVYLGSYKLAYGGRQFSYCFFLATLTSTRMPTSLNEARDRVFGVMLGIFVMWVVYDQMLPVRTSVKMREAVAGALKVLEQIRPLRTAPCCVEDKLRELAKVRSLFGKSMQSLQLNVELRAFEVTMTQTVHKRRLPVLQQVISLLLQVFLRDITAVEGEILDLKTARQRDRSSDEGMRQLRDLAKSLAAPPTLPSSGVPTSDGALLTKVHAVLQEALLI